MIRRTAASASSGSSQTTTPLPLARPAAFTTTGVSCACTYATADSTFSNVRDSAVGIIAARINCFAQALSPSSRAPSAPGPNTFKPALRKRSPSPAHSGSSGPITMNPIFSCRHSVTTSSTVFVVADSAFKSTFRPTDAVPALPGANRSLPQPLLCFSFHPSACSRPPPPITNTFIAIVRTSLASGPFVPPS